MAVTSSTPPTLCGHDTRYCVSYGRLAMLLINGYVCASGSNVRTSMWNVSRGVSDRPVVFGKGWSRIARVGLESWKITEVFDVSEGGTRVRGGKG